MGGFELMFQVIALLLGLSMAELLGGLARSWRIRAGAIRTGEAAIRIGLLIPLLGLLVLVDQTRLWITIYTVRAYLDFEYATLLAVLAVVGGYFVVSTFVFPDEPKQWPHFDDYYLHVNRTVIGGMILVNFATMLYAAILVAGGVPLASAPVARSWFSIGAALLFPPGLVALWFVKSRRANLALMTFMNLLLIVVAIAQTQS